MDLYEEISKVAYEIWLKKGMPIGNDMENWLEAEQIVYASLRDKKEKDNLEVEAYSSAMVVTEVAEPEKDTNIETKEIEKVVVENDKKTTKKATIKKATPKKDSTKSTAKKITTSKKKKE
ncbi:MAG: DUF2934 domain-containing protein [Thermodesulfovibrionales bacterium]|nr:DUF2934 domain-containing protein [Thermodesulfovibrionales bacterium]